jgi:acyl-CoA reductase-like NAD-dependent aldehyde dehydrogenase
VEIGKLYIDGQWLDGKDTFLSVNPSTGKSFGTVYNGTEDEVDAAVKAARKALPSWVSLGVDKRAEIISKVVDLLVEKYGQQGDVTELKKLIGTEMGKRLPEADIEVIESSDMLKFFAQEGPRLLQPKALQLDEQLWSSKKSYVTFEAVGVIGVIKPWNYPLELPIWTIGPALVAGNTVVFKPSEHSSFVGIAIGKLFEEAGLPSGVFNIVTGDGETGRHLVKHDNVDMIAFTGSVRVGQEIAVECAKRMRKCSLELGGNDAAIIENDVDLELAANGIVWGSFCNGGQVCVRPKRVFVNQMILEDLLNLILEKTKALRLGIDFGPIVSEPQLKIIETQIHDAVSQGAKILVGGHRALSEEGFYFLPTVMKNINQSMSIMTEECFGPVLPIISVENTEEAISLANSSEYGLGASVWTSDLKKGEKIANSLEAGMVWINDVNVAFPQAPWGGIKRSGLGIDLSEWSFYEFVHKKHINIETSNEVRRAWWYPY